MTKKISKVLMASLLIVFVIMYYFGGNIYDYKIIEKKNLTEEQIKKFEIDVKEGKEIDIEEYVVKDRNYSNKVTRLNTKISNIIETGFKKIFEYFLKNVNI
ncbi:MAG: hypothetical protein IJ568_02260 [Bacilli bacterium]|nr:hypothetical protein [Bacilli bacterium]